MEITITRRNFGHEEIDIDTGSKSISFRRVDYQGAFITEDGYILDSNGLASLLEDAFREAKDSVGMFIKRVDARTIKDNGEI